MESNTDKELLAAIVDRGRELLHVYKSPAWETILDILRETVEEQKLALIQADGSNTAQVLSFHAQARAAEYIMQMLVAKVEDSITAAKGLSSMSATTGTDYYELTTS